MDYLQNDEVTTFYISPFNILLFNIFTSLRSQYTFQLIDLPNVFGITCNMFTLIFKVFSHHKKRNL